MRGAASRTVLSSGALSQRPWRARHGLGKASRRRWLPGVVVRGIVTERQSPLPSADAHTEVAGPAVAAGVSAWRRGVVRWLILPTGDPANAIYGTILVAAVVAAEDPQQTQSYEIALTVAVTVVVFWLAHGYARVISSRLSTGAGLSLGEVRAALAEHWPIVQAAVPPMAVLAIAAGEGATVEGAQQAALWTSVVLLGIWSTVAGRASQLVGWRLVCYAGSSAVLGFLMIILEVLIH